MRSILLLTFTSFIAQCYGQTFTDAPYPAMSYDATLCADELFKTQTICLNERISEETNFNYTVGHPLVSTLCEYSQTTLPAYNNLRSGPQLFNIECPGVCVGGFNIYDSDVNRTSFYTIDLICVNNPGNVAITKTTENCWNVQYISSGTYLFNLNISVRHGRDINNPSSSGFITQDDTTFYNSCGENRTWKQFTVQVGSQFQCNDYVENQCNLIENGGFEDMINCPTTDPSLTGFLVYNQNFSYLNNWNRVNSNAPTFQSTCGDFFGNYIAYQNIASKSYPPQPLPSGDNYIGFFPTPHEMGQFVQLCPNQKYKFGFKGVKIRGNSIATYNINLNGLNTFSFPTAAPQTNLASFAINNISFAWNTYTSTFTCPAAFSAISINGLNTMIDDVELIPVDTVTYTAQVTSVACDSAELTLNIPGCYGPYDVSVIVNGVPITYTNISDGAVITVPLGNGNTVTIGSITNSVGCTTILNSVSTVTIPNPGNASFIATDFCYGGQNSITFLGDQGVFSLVGNATSATIHPTTGIISNAAPNTSYTIQHKYCLDMQQETIFVTNHDASFTTNDICIGESNVVQITGEIGGVFEILPPNLGATINPSTGVLSGVTVNSNYSIQYVVGATCQDTVVQVVHVNPLDNAGFTTNDFCFNSTNVVTITGSTGGTFSFLLPPTDGATINAATGIISNPTVGQSYTIQYRTNGACRDSSTQMVTVLPLPTAVLSGTGGDLCISDSLPITITLTGVSPWNITLSNGVSTFVLTSTANTLTHYIGGIGNYSITSVSDAQCSNVGDTIHTVEMTGEAIIPYSNAVNGCAPSEVEFWTNLSGNDLDCVWNFGDGNVLAGCDTVSHTYTQSGIYTVQFSVSSARCQADTILSQYIEIFEDPVANFSIDPLNPTIINNNVNMVNTSVNNDQNQWYLNQSIVSLSPEPRITFPALIQQNELCLVVESIHNCFDTACLQVFVNDASILFLPNTFIPDNDGLNDIFKPEGSNIRFYKLQIFDRWGTVIFETEDFNEGWDGTYKGREAQVGTYVYKLAYRYNDMQENQVVHGHVNLMR